MYVINPHHRNGNNNKSQWTISEPEEIKCFDLARDRGWLAAEKGWGLHIVGSQATWLGIAQDRTTLLFIAKFIASALNAEWHGYPADYRNNHHDIPDEGVLRKWLAEGGLSAAKVRKIARGQPCNL